MNKFLLFSTLLLLSSVTPLAQVSSFYAFTGSAGTFAEITGGTVLGSGTFNDNVYNAKSIGFTFTFNGVDYTQFSVNANGWLCMGAVAVNSYYPISNGTSDNVISAVGQDIQGTSNGKLRYQLLGTSPDRTLVVQWLHVKKHGNAGNGDDWNFQIRLYETSNNIEIVYGAFTTNTTSTTVEVGLRGVSNDDYNNRTTTTNWAGTTNGTSNNDFCTLSDAVYPESGQTFTWTIPPYCNSFALYPDDEEIFSVTVAGNTNAYNCTTVAPGPGSSLNQYSNFYPLGSLANLPQLGFVPFTVEEDECDGSPYYSNGCAIWVDFNQDGDFTDAGEQVYSETGSGISPRTITGTIAVPAGAMLGVTAMRITVAENFYGEELTPCLIYDYGETEDYLVTIALPPSGTLQGHVYEQPACTAPLNGATVTDGTYTTLTNADGFYQFPNLPVGNYDFTASLTGYEDQTIDGITIEEGATASHDFCLGFYYAPPVNVEAVVSGPMLNNVNLTWMVPGSFPNQWISWDDGTKYTSIGGSADFMVASRWPADDIAPFAGRYLRKISFFPDVAGIYTLKIWTSSPGDFAPAEVYSYPVSVPVPGVWNTVSFPGVSIPPGEDFWFGYEVSTIGLVWPAGCDDGPAIVNKGDMIYYDYAGVWESMSAAYGYDYNWCLHGFVSGTASGPEPLTPIVQNTGQKRQSDPLPKMLAPLLLPSLTGYNVYRNSVEIADNIPDTSYVDLSLPKGSYDYQVSAKYDNGGESAKTAPVHVDIITCFPPTNVQIPGATTTTNSAHASWTASTITPNPEWICEYGPAGFIHGSGTGGPQYIENPFMTMNNLSPGTEYDFYVRTFCTAGDSSAWVKKTFCTHYFECPEGATSEAEPCGSELNDGCYMTVPAFEPMECGETKCGTVDFNGPFIDTDWYQFTLTETTEVTLSGKAEFFWLMGIYASGCPTSDFIISAIEFPGTTVSFTTPLAAGTYYAVAGPLAWWPPYAFSCDSLNRYYVTLTCNTCISPSALTATNITATSADLSWVHGNTETAWEYVIGPSPLPVPSGPGIPTTTDPATVTGLSQGTTYCYYVRSSCGSGNYSLWAGPYCFSTLCEPFTLTHCEPFASNILPACWSQTYSGLAASDYWVITSSNEAGGTAPNEMTCSMVDETGTVRLISGAYSTSGLSSVHLAFRQIYDDYNAGVNDVNIMLQSSPDGVVWTTQWMHPGGIGSSIPAELKELDVPVTGSTVYFAWTVDGSLRDITYWCVDDICVFAPITTKTLNLKVYLEGLYAGGGLMNKAQDEFGDHFPGNTADQVAVELHNPINYSTLEYTSGLVDLSTGGNITITTIPDSYNGSYYITIRHRNSIETTSASPVSFAGVSTSYDFTAIASQAYGGNMKLMGTAWVIYGGDATHDGFVDGSDMAAIDNASTAVLVGYNPEDINGDGIVDGSDMAVVDNNSTDVVHAMKP